MSSTCTAPDCTETATVRVADTISLESVDRCDVHSPSPERWTVVPFCSECEEDVLKVSDAIYARCDFCGEEFLRDEVDL